MGWVYMEKIYNGICFFTKEGDFAAENGRRVSIQKKCFLDSMIRKIMDSNDMRSYSVKTLPLN